MKKVLIPSLVLTLALAGCGGGGTSSGGGTPVTGGGGTGGGGTGGGGTGGGGTGGGGTGGGGTGGGGTLTTSTSFVTPITSGEFPNDLDNALAGQLVDGSDGFGFQVGNDGTQLTGRAGIIPTTSVSAVPLSGSAMLTGNYQLRTVTNATIVNGAVDGTDFGTASMVTLTADFGAQTLTGQDASNPNGTFAVDGDFNSSGTLTGSVTFDGLSADLTGVVGADQAVGAFQGSTADSVIVGGFLVD